MIVLRGFSGRRVAPISSAAVGGQWVRGGNGD